MRVNGTISNHITSHPARDRWLSGTFVSSSLRIYLCLRTATCLGVLLHASDDVLRAQIRAENMSDPLLDQRSHQSRCREGQNAWLLHLHLAGWCCCFCESSNPRRHFCYYLYYFPYAPLTSLRLFLSLTRSCSLNFESEIGEHYHSQAPQGVGR